jgi:2-methylisocitrate lyase-like PEP mutase family enzyme
MTVPSFRSLIEAAQRDKTCLIVPGVHDALSARLVEREGFASYFVGGFAVVGARFAAPDLGLKGFGEISGAVRDIIAASSLPAFVDGDDGYGDVKNIVHTVHEYERMGVSALLFEDQAWPKRCGHMAGKKLVPAELMEAKIRAATSERLDTQTWILARTDARATHDLDEALRRAERYVAAGADGIFIEAPQSLAEIERIGRAFDVPQIANPLMGGTTPILAPQELGALGFSAAIYGLDTLMHAAKAVEAVLRDMKSGRFALRDQGMGFQDYQRLVDAGRWDGIDDRYGWPRPGRS